MKAAGKVIAVTGAGNGMGREITLLLLKRGSRVAAIDLNAAALEETARLSGDTAGRLSLHAVDISNQSEVEKLPEAILSHHGQIDGLINNAGIIQPFVKLQALGYDSIFRVMNINFYGLLFMTKTFLPYLLQRPEAHIVNISSMGGYLPVPGQTVYGASKAAVKLLTEGLRSELKNTPVQVSLVFPGAVGTQIAANSGVILDMGKPDDKPSITPLAPARAAEIIINGMEKNKPRIFAGKDAKAMDLLYRFHPTFAADFIYRKMVSLLK